MRFYFSSNKGHQINNQCERLTFFSSPVFKKPGIYIFDMHIFLIRFIYSIHIVFSFVCVLTWSLLGVKNKLVPRPDRSPLGV